jgi:ATP-binding cassette subfamily F protein 1
MQAQKMNEMTKAWENQQKELKRLKASGASKKDAEKKATASKGKQKNQDKANAKKNRDTFAGDEAGAKKELLARPREYVVNFEFPSCGDLRPPILSVENVSFKYPGDHPYLFRNTEFGIHMSSRISIVGPNGVGKSTLLKLICQDESPVS